jgi:integrase/recombinase XerD
MSLFSLFEQFLKEKQFLIGISPKTIRSYQQAFKAYQRVLSSSGKLRDGEPLDTPTKDTLKDFVIGMREQGLSPGACNVYIRSINSFLTWLHENSYVTEPLRLRQLPQPKTVVKVFTEKHVQALIRFKPQNEFERRTHTLICLLIDTGARIDEALTCLVSNVDLDQLIVKVRGKGNKERLLPISVEMRKILWVYLTRYRFKVPSDYLFPTRDGNGLEYHNILRDIKELCGRLGIEGVRLSPHGFRHFFSCNYMKRGGEIYRLSRLLGHTSVRTTEIYLQSMGVESISEGHRPMSALSKLG